MNGRGSPKLEPNSVEAAGSTGSDDYRDYLADMILELRTMALKSGRTVLAAQLLAAYDVARGEGQAKN